MTLLILYKKKMKINIPAVITPVDGYYDILKLMAYAPPYSTLRNRELEVLAELMYWYNFYGAYDKDVRNIMVFDYNTRQKIMDKLNIDVNVLNNNFTSLRKKGFVKGRELVKFLPDLRKIDVVEITFNCKVNGD